MEAGRFTGTACILASRDWGLICRQCFCEKYIRAKQCRNDAKMMAF